MVTKNRSRQSRSRAYGLWVVPRLFSAAVLVMLISSCGVSSTSEWSRSVPGNDARTPTALETPYGPVSPADVKMLVAIAQAGMWEAPASELVAARSKNSKVQSVAAQLAREHHTLHLFNQAAAQRLRIQLPESATPQQNSWREKIDATTGSDGDKVYVELTRSAHGTVFMAIATVRSTTQNDVIRTMANIANEYVGRHMSLLESTGLANSDSLAVHAGTDAPYQPLPSWSDIALGLGLAVAASCGTLAVVRAGSHAAAPAAEGVSIE